MKENVLCKVQVFLTQLAPHNTTLFCMNYVFVFPNEIKF